MVDVFAYSHKTSQGEPDMPDGESEEEIQGANASAKQKQLGRSRSSFYQTAET